MHPIVEKENFYQKRIKSIPDDEKQRAGALLRCVPDRTEWEELQQMLKNSPFVVNFFYNQACPHLLLVLYAGVAFHEYKDASFWPQFCRVVGVPFPLPGGRQQKLNKNFARAADAADLPIIKNAAGVLLSARRCFSSGFRFLFGMNF